MNPRTLLSGLASSALSGHPRPPARGIRRAIFFIFTLGVLLLLGWISLFNGIDILYPIDKTEALQLELARQMFASGDWVTPSIDNHVYFDKPPLPYWIGSFFLSIRGDQSTEFWTPRIGASLAGMIGVISTFLLTFYANNDEFKRRISRAASAAAILLLMPFYAGFSRVALHDIYLTASITVALTVIFLHSQSSNRGALQSIVRGTVLGCSLGIGVLAKGLLAPVLVSAIAIGFLLASQRTKLSYFNYYFIATCLFVFTLIAMPWHLSAWQSHGASFIDTYLGRTQLTRFTTELDNHSGPWFFYLLFYPAITAPWVLPAAHSLIRNKVLNLRHIRHKLESNKLEIFAFIWILVTLALFSLASTKLPHYILPSLPPTAIAASYFFFPLAAGQNHSHRFSRLLLIFTGSILIIASCVLILTPAMLLPISRNSPDFSLALRSYLASPPIITFFLFFGVTGCAMGARAKHHLELLLGVFWAFFISSVLLFISPSILKVYHTYHQLPRLQLADQALLQSANQGEPILVVGKSWYSVRIRTNGRAQILEKGKAFNADPTARLPDCASSLLILGPTTEVQSEAQRCPANALTLLNQTQSGRLSLGRLAPKTL